MPGEDFLPYWELLWSDLKAHQGKSNNTRLLHAALHLAGQLGDDPDEAEEALWSSVRELKELGVLREVLFEQETGRAVFDCSLVREAPEFVEARSREQIVALALKRRRKGGAA